MVGALFVAVPAGDPHGVEPGVPGGFGWDGGLRDELAYRYGAPG